MQRDLFFVLFCFVLFCFVLLFFFVFCFLFFVFFFFCHLLPNRGLSCTLTNCTTVSSQTARRSKHFFHHCICNCIETQNVFWEKVYFRSQILERPSIGEYWNIFVYQYCLKIWYLHSLERAGVVQKLIILERKNGLVLSNTCVPVSGTQSILFPRYYLHLKNTRIPLLL